MKKLILLAMLLVASLSFAQVDINIVQVGPYTTFARNWNWAGTGVGNISNNYIMTPVQPDSGVCLYLYNNDSGSTHSVLLNVWQTGDPAVTSFQSNQTSWQGLGSNIGLQAVASGLTTYFFKASGAAKIAFVVSAGGGTGTATLVAVQTNSNCGQQGTLPVYCPLSATASVTTGTTSILVSAGAFFNSVGAIHICSYQVSIAGATVTVATDAFIYGTGAACAGSPTTVGQIKNPATSAFFPVQGGGQELFPLSGTNQVARNFCYTDGGTTSGSIVNITYGVY